MTVEEREIGSYPQASRAGERSGMLERMATSPTLRFLTLDDVCEILAIGRPTAYSLVRSGQLRALRVGDRGQWRIAAADLDAYIESMYSEASERQ